MDGCNWRVLVRLEGWVQLEVFSEAEGMGANGGY